MTRREQRDGLVVVITGASSGIGRATAEAFARDGAQLVLAARDGAALEAVAGHCRVLGATTEVVPTDVTDAAAVRHLASRALAFAGRIDVWVSNVGVGAVGRFHETPAAAHEQIIRANLIGHMNDAHAAVPVFLKQGQGVFINMISLGGFAASPFAAAYSASKFGLKGFSESLRAELADQPDIHICDVYPSFIDTPGLRHGANYTGRQIKPMPPVHDPRRVAAAIVGLARRPRPQVIVGPEVHLLRLGHLLGRDTGARMAARVMERYFRRADPAPVTDGNLFNPPEDPGGIDGGFRSRRGRPSLALGGLAVAGMCAVALAVLAAQPGNRRHVRGGRRHGMA